MLEINLLDGLTLRKLPTCWIYTIVTNKLDRGEWRMPHMLHYPYSGQLRVRGLCDGGRVVLLSLFYMHEHEHPPKTKARAIERGQPCKRKQR